jgi:hypothetical protein
MSFYDEISMIYDENQLSWTAGFSVVEGEEGQHGLARI